MIRISTAATAILIVASTLMQANAQTYADFPAQVVRDALATANCPQTDVSTFGVRPATTKHRECLYLALEVIGCNRGNVDLCFQSLWNEVPPRRAPGAPRPLTEPPYWTDERVARLFAGYLPGTGTPEFVRATPHVAAARLETLRPPPPPPDAIQAVERVMSPIQGNTDPLQGPQLFAEVFGMELRPRPQGGWTIGRIALNSAAWFSGRFLTGTHVNNIAFQTLDGPQDGNLYEKCADDACLEAKVAQLVLGDRIWPGGIAPLDVGIPALEGAPWIALTSESGRRAVSQRVDAQLAFARTGLILENVQSLRVAHVAPGSLAEVAGVQEGDRFRNAGYFGDLNVAVGVLAWRIEPIDLPILRDEQRINLVITPTQGATYFENGVAMITPGIGIASRQPGMHVRAERDRQRALEARMERPFSDFHPDLAAVLQLIYDGQHREARTSRRSYTIRNSPNPMITLMDLQMTMVYDFKQSLNWSDLPLDYGFARSQFLGNCGDVVPRLYTTITTRNGVEVGQRSNFMMFFLRGLENRLAQSIEQTGQINLLLGVDPDLNGWPSFFQEFPCGSPVIERLDREFLAFAGR